MKTVAQDGSQADPTIVFRREDPVDVEVEYPSSTQVMAVLRQRQCEDILGRLARVKPPAVGAVEAAPERGKPRREGTNRFFWCLGDLLRITRRSRQRKAHA